MSNWRHWFHGLHSVPLTERLKRANLERLKERNAAMRENAEKQRDAHEAMKAAGVFSGRCALCLRTTMKHFGDGPTFCTNCVRRAADVRPEFSAFDESAESPRGWLRERFRNREITSVADFERYRNEGSKTIGDTIPFVKTSRGKLRGGPNPFAEINFALSPGFFSGVTTDDVRQPTQWTDERDPFKAKIAFQRYFDEKLKESEDRE